MLPLKQHLKTKIHDIRTFQKLFISAKVDQDRRIGMWPFIKQVPAQKSSKQRKRGTLKTKPRNVTAAAHKETMPEKVLPAMKNKWQSVAKKRAIWINEDNPMCHPESTRTAVQDAAAINGWDISGCPQPCGDNFCCPCDDVQCAHVMHLTDAKQIGGQ